MTRGKSERLKQECIEAGTWLHKNRNRRLYDVRGSCYVNLADPAIRARLLAGERVRGGVAHQEDVTAEVLAGLVMEEVRAGRITAEPLRGFLNQVVGDVPAVREERTGSPVGLV